MVAKCQGRDFTNVALGSNTFIILFSVFP